MKPAKAISLINLWLIIVEYAHSLIYQELKGAAGKRLPLSFVV